MSAAPFDGVVSAHLVSVGELVGASSPTQLATIVQLDPIWVNFNVNEQDVLRIRAEARRRGMTADELRQLPVEVGLQTETGYPHKGKLDYAVADAQPVDRHARRCAACCRNADRALLPGYFVRVRVPFDQAAERAAGARRRARQRPGRPLRAGRQRRQCRRAAQGADRAGRMASCA